MDRKLKTFFKRAIFLLCLGIVIILVLGNQKAEMTGTDVHYVKPGDTLWSIAEQYNGESVDKRYVVYYMKEMNDGLTSTIQIGQEIIVPIYE